jgi:hypothetical protein
MYNTAFMPPSVRLFLFFAAFIGSNCATTHTADDKGPVTVRYPSKRTDLQQLSKAFSKFSMVDTNSSYTITLCADVPYNKNPAKVLYRKQPGHVFLIFEQVLNASDTIRHAFGFYPVRPASVVLFKNVRGEIRNNQGREYDTEMRLPVSTSVFFALLDSSVVLGMHKYNLNKYNCYDYSLHLFNMAAGTHPLQIQYVKFPFIWGKGGSPTGLYHQFTLLKESDSFCSAHIRFGAFKTPQNRGE